ncbi:MAG: GNAT family N-acetyltransferase, partial [Actinomycetota bacterium]|nr:GNAT family N-acetyltransferase [Actinomycetota bacterium]
MIGLTVLHHLTENEVTMNTAVRPYEHSKDYEAINRLLIDVYQPGEQLSNWLQPRWEYMHFHPLINDLPLERIGVFEQRGEIVGLAHFEHSLAFIYLQSRPGYEQAWPMMLDYVETTFGGRSKMLEREIIGLFVNEFDSALEVMVADRGFESQDKWAEEYSRYAFGRPVPVVGVPDGYRLQSLADENDYAKTNRVLWRGFNHEGPPPDAEIAGRIQAQSAPNFRNDLNIVVVAPDGNYASYAGMWFVPENKVAYVEPVATDPDFRRLGLGRAAVLETLRRVGDLGAESVWVGSGLEFYLS